MTELPNCPCCGARLSLNQASALLAELKATTPRRETYSRKRYVAVCVGCGGLFDTGRRDQLTCSGACRQKANRNGELARIRALAKSFDIGPAGILWARALTLLRPDLEPQVMAGKLTLEAAMPELAAAFDRLVMKRAREHPAAAP